MQQEIFLLQAEPEEMAERAEMEEMVQREVLRMQVVQEVWEALQESVAKLVPVDSLD
jgi:hypothetical protein